VPARNFGFEDGKTKRLHERCRRVLRDGQDHAVGFLLPPLTVIAAVMIMGDSAVLVCFGVNGVMLGRFGQLLEEMMHPMGSGGDQEETKRGGGAQMEAALKLRDYSSCFHRVSAHYPRRNGRQFASGRSILKCSST
jgi:hypothetical protein